MQLAMIGLGRMGGNMVQRLLEGGHQLVVFDRSAGAVQSHVAMGATGAKDLAQLCSQLQAPRVVWVMVPAGAPVESTIEELLPGLSKGDIIIDGGNSNFKDSIRRAAWLKGKGLEFIDAGTSGGIWGLKVGYCLMIGASPEAFKHCEPIFRTLAPAEGYAHVGPPGAGHYVKMIHNGIEYGMLQAYAEGFDLLQSAHEYDFDLKQLATLWNHSSVVRSWLLELAEDAFEKDPHLSSIQGYVDDSGEGRWTVLEAVERGVNVSVLAEALFARFTSREDNPFAMRVIAALRNEFGGHAVKEK
jgi:6-phosphogluconate dehydrogenase